MDFVKREKEILEFWKKNKIFEKLREKIKGKRPWSFLDGPITANNPMGVHHAWGRTYKDLFQRYKAMRGYDQRFQNGFDCQGLWVEVEVEKELGFKNKKDIEKYGIENFVKKCKERVLKYSRIQTEQSIRLGQWMDWQNSYFTMSEENNYAIWHFLKKCHQKGILYKGRDVVPWCPRCGTAISQHEILTEEYKELVHRAVFVKFPVLGKKNTFFLVWTTTPWTLPANVALAVHPEFFYAILKSKTTSDNEKLVLLKDKAEILEGNYEIIKVIKGKKLKGEFYQGLFDELPKLKENFKSWQHSVILWEEISQKEGTGIVHIAPGCGEEDFQLSKEFSLPVIDCTDDESRYQKGFGFLEGRFVFEKETQDLILKFLSKKELLFKVEDFKHRYPTCWRCKTELIFRLVDEWYLKMDPLREALKQSAKKIKWLPSFGLERELDWLKNMKDWLISKKRYWGLSLPIWECSCQNFEVIGSKEELKEKAVKGWEEFEPHSPHRPWIDKVKITCSKCKKIISRIPDVGNPWLDAGIVPFSTLGYFRDRRFWKKWFPAELVCESFPGQFKNWFYSILVMSQVLENQPPVKIIFGYASVVDEKGEEMHKSKGNAIWFDQAVERIGADAMRWLYLRPNPFSNLKFGYHRGEEIKRKLLVLWNCYLFFLTYKEKQLEKEFQDDLKFISKNILDKWILSRLNNLIEKVTNFLENYDPMRATLSLESFFLKDLSLWYIRRSRKRFQNPKFDREKKEAQKTLYQILLTLAKLLSPMIPFFAENVYQKLRSSKMPLSVHLLDWPKSEKFLKDEDLEKKMEKAQQIVTQALRERSKFAIKVRQPLAKLKIKDQILKKEKEILNLIAEEVNVKEIVFDSKIEKEIELTQTLTPELKEEGEKREILRHLQNLRKIAGLTPQDKMVIYFGGDFELEKLFQKNQQELTKTTRARRAEKISFSKSCSFSFDAKKTLKINQKELFLGIKKI